MKHTPNSRPTTCRRTLVRYSRYLLFPASFPSLTPSTVTSAPDEFERSYGGLYDDRGYSVRETEDGGSVITGATWPFGKDKYDVYLIQTDPEVIVGIDAAEPVSMLPRSTILSQNHPNPFNPETTIGYSLPFAAKVSRTVYDIWGQKVRALVDAEQKAGHHTAHWDGKNDSGGAAASGTYLYQLDFSRLSQTRKISLLK